MSFDLAIEFLKMFLIGSGFGLVVGLLILFKQRKKDKENRQIENKDKEKEVN